MADEQAQVETTTTEQTTEVTDVNVSEDDKTPLAETTEKRSEPDLSVALKEERLKRQELERSLKDPNYVYELARQHGLTAEEAQDMIDEQTSEPEPRGVKQPKTDFATLVDRQVEARLDYNEAIRQMPEIVEDESLRAWAASLVDSGKKYTEAVSIIRAKQQEWSAKGATESAKVEQEIDRSREQATTAPPTGGQQSTARSEAEAIRARMKSEDPNIQMRAYEEWQLYKLRNPNIKK